MVVAGHAHHDGVVVGACGDVSQFKCGANAVAGDSGDENFIGRGGAGCGDESLGGFGVV